MIESIKITSLTNIGSNLSYTSIFPVVNVTGSPFTNKANLQIIGNYILSQAGGANMVQAAQATLAQAVVNSAQPNITSVGTLSINTLNISGGTNGQYLQTNGSGNLAWVSGGGSGNGVVGGSNTQIQFNNAGNFGGNSGLTWNGSTGALSTLNLSVSSGATIYGNTALTNLNVAGNLTTNNIFTDNYYYANGTPFSGGGNGDYSNSNVVSLLSAFGSNTITTTGNVSVGNIIGNGQALTNIAGANVSGFVPNANVANTAFAVAAANVSGLGNIATINLTGSNANVLYGNGVFAAAAGGNANTGNVTFSDINVIGTGNLNLQPNPADAGRYLDIYLTGNADIHVAVGSAGANLILGTDEEANISVLQGGNVAIQAGNVSGTQTWTFDTTGDINIPPNANSSASGRIQSANGYPTLLAYGTGSHGGPELTWADTDDVNDLGNANVLRNTMYINESGLWVGMNENLVANTFAGTWNFTPNGTIIFPTLEVDLHNGGVQTGQVLQFGNSSQQAIITGPTPSANNAAERLIIQGQRGNGTGEGGDVYVWGGDADTNGGDIKIYAGDADNVAAGSGGYVNIDGGAGFDDGGGITLTGGISANGYGGTVNITGGSGELGGGAASLQGGYGGNGQGGTVQIVGGGGNSQSSYGNVEIGSGTYAWLFNNSGNLVLPGNTFAVNYANGTQVPLGGGANTGNIIFDQSTIESNQSNAYINLNASGSGVLSLGTNDQSNVRIVTDEGNVNNQWTFGTDGSLTLPIGVSIDYNGNVQYPKIIADSGKLFSVQGQGNTGSAALAWTVDPNAASQYAAVSVSRAGGDDLAKVVLQAQSDSGNVATVKIWQFSETGNLTLPTGGQIIVSGGLVSSGASPAPTINGFSITNSVGISGNGNIAGNNISATGNISANNFTGNGGTLSNVATKVEGSWTLASGTNTVSISVPGSGTYSLWVNGNIPNGIITYIATAVVTNTNVPVLGEQYAWYYALGNALVLTSIPDQFVGTVGAISNVNTYAGNTANVFTFGITNNSGNIAVVNYGYTKL